MCMCFFTENEQDMRLGGEGGTCRGEVCGLYFYTLGIYNFHID